MENFRFIGAAPAPPPCFQLQLPMVGQPPPHPSRASLGLRRNPQIDFYTSMHSYFQDDYFDMLLHTVLLSTKSII